MYHGGGWVGEELAVLGGLGDRLGDGREARRETQTATGQMHCIMRRSMRLFGQQIVVERACPISDDAPRSVE